MLATAEPATGTVRAGSGGRSRWASAMAPVAYCAVVTAVSFHLFERRAYDDPFITYRYAQNLLHGSGFVYNAGERVLSTTAPLYALLLAALGALWPALPKLSNLVGCVSVAAGGWLLWRLTRRWDGEGLALVLLLYPLTSILYQSLGGEMPLLMALCLALLLAYTEGHQATAAAVAAVAVLTRGDAAVLVGVLAADHWILRRRPVPWRAVAVFGGLTGAWIMFAMAYYGSPVPATLAAKRLQGGMAISQPFAAGLVSLAAEYLRSWPYRIEGALLVVGAVVAFAGRREWRLFLAWPVLYALAYAALGVPRYFWYYVPFVPATVFLLAVAVRALYRWLGRGRAKPLALAVSALLVVGLACVHAGRVLRLSRQVDSMAQAYRAVGEWIAGHTPPEASVGALEVGIIGFYGERRMVDFAGLVQPDVARHLEAGSTYDDAAVWAVDAYSPNYVVVERRLMPELAQRMTDECVVVARFIGSGGVLARARRATVSRAPVGRL